MEDKIKLAIEYVTTHIHDDDARNDAANIFASNYEEYCYIWNALGEIEILT